MLNYDEFFDFFLKKIHNQGLFREFLPLTRFSCDRPIFCSNDKKIITVWCSNDYLNMSNHPVVKRAVIDSIDKGCGSGGTRNISGTSNEMCELEYEIADMHNKESALLFSSGFAANDSSIPAIAKILGNDLVIFSDKLNHASIIDGIRKSKAKYVIFKHNDVSDLESKLATEDCRVPKLIIFESLYSMDGDFAHIENICNLAKKYNALTYIDEVHSVGIYGNKGGGIAQKNCLEGRIDIIQGSLSKAFGSIGGYISASKTIIDSIKSCCSGFIFTSALPPTSVAASLASVRHLKKSSVERLALHKIVDKVKACMKANNIKIMNDNSHILPVIIGDHRVAESIFANLLLKRNIFAQYMKYPTVPLGTSRFRITPNIGHSDEMIEDFINSFSNALSEELKGVNDFCY